MNLSRRNLIKRRKLISFYLISIATQITIFILIQLSSFLSQVRTDDLWFNFLTQTIEPYTDYKFWYQPIAYQFLHKDWLPYIKLVNLVFNPQGLRPFIYPPLFFYVLVIPAFLSIDLVVVPLLLSNILLPVVVYKMLIQSKNQKVAEWGFIATALCPLYLFYTGGLALNPSLMILFFVLSLYYISINRFNIAIIMFSISILFKQVNVLFIPPILIYIILKSCSEREKITIFDYIKKSLQYSILLGILLIVGSLPWVLIAPQNYITSLTAYGTFRPTLNPYFGVLYKHYNIPRFWYDFLIDLNPPYEVFYVFGFLNFSYVGLVIIEIGVIVFIIYWHFKKELSWIRFLNIILYTTFLTFLFFPRGNYKYYYTFFVPLIILWICFNFHQKILDYSSKRKRWFLIMIIISLSFMLIHRYYYQLLVWGIFIYILIQNRNIRKKNSKKNSIKNGVFFKLRSKFLKSKNLNSTTRESYPSKFF